MHHALRPILLCGLAATIPAQLTVSAVEPARNAVGAATNPRIAMTFAQALNPATVSSATVRVFGRWSGVVDGTVALENGNRTITFTAQRPLFPGEWVTVSASSTVADGSGNVLVGGHAFGFWTASAPGSYQFTNVRTLAVRRQGEGQVRTYGANAADINRDGIPDLSLPNENSDDVRVMYGDGCDSFGAPNLHPLPSGSVPSPNEAEDFNGDGWTDLAVGCPGAGTVAVYLNDGSGSYLAPVIYPSGANTRGIAVLDAEGDGDVDIIAANPWTNEVVLHANNGNGTFAAGVAVRKGGQPRGITAADVNNDGWMDLFVGDFSGSVYVLIADGAGGFALGVSSVVPGQPWMIAAGDVDGDGNVDVVTANSSSSTASVVRGDGLGGLSAATSVSVGAFPLAVDLGDLDGDGDLELVVSSFSGSDFTVYRNAGGSFGAPFSLPTGAAGSCALLVDFDRDGDLDILGIDELDDVVHLFAQNGPAPGGVQAPRCAATLRVDNFADRGGFGTAPAHVARLGRPLHLGVTAAPQAPFVLMLGQRLVPGVNSTFGLFNLTGVGVFPLPAGQVGNSGEGQQTLFVPPTLTIGDRLTFQGVVLDQVTPLVLLLTNPEEIVIGA